MKLHQGDAHLTLYPIALHLSGLQLKVVVTVRQRKKLEVVHNSCRIFLADAGY